MALFSHVRSISMPNRSHTKIQDVEECLNKLRNSEPSTSSKAETVNDRLTSLLELYSCVEDLLQLPQTQQGLSHNSRQRWVGDVLEGSVKLLDLYQAQDLQTVLHRRGGESVKEAKVGAYILFRKKMKTNISKFLPRPKGNDQPHMLTTQKDMGEIEYVDVPLQSLSRQFSSKKDNIETVQQTQTGLEALVASTEDLEIKLQCMLKNLILSLLNIYTH
ncbi:hypothetical protein AQUCO_01500478v1 [Aquilegia coerulea]|uniref:Uncharacterized protein n=1 Tax=Aquilegia coerulea TaxID=218851 RepID=A0A2G5DTZ9_AQUCA|nr:hypothetical protein AQUCO_01500478v1 [Aquilegia coerulea]